MSMLLALLHAMASNLESRTKQMKTCPAFLARAAGSSALFVSLTSYLSLSLFTRTTRYSALFLSLSSCQSCPHSSVSLGAFARVPHTPSLPSSPSPPCPFTVLPRRIISRRYLLELFQGAAGRSCRDSCDYICHAYAAETEKIQVHKSIRDRSPAQKEMKMSVGPSREKWNIIALRMKDKPKLVQRRRKELSTLDRIESRPTCDDGKNKIGV